MMEAFTSSEARMVKIAATLAVLVLGTAGIALAQGIAPTTPSSPGAAAPDTSKSLPGTFGTPRGSAETSGSGSSTPKRMTPADVKEALEQQGYAEVTDVVESTGGFTATAKKDGRQVKLNIDPSGKASHDK
jgi:hypothetical protein